MRLHGPVGLLSIVRAPQRAGYAGVHNVSPVVVHDRKGRGRRLVNRLKNNGRRTQGGRCKNKARASRFGDEKDGMPKRYDGRARCRRRVTTNVNEMIATADAGVVISRDLARARIQAQSIVYSPYRSLHCSLSKQRASFVSSCFVL